MNKPSKMLVLDLINFQNNSTLNPNDVDLLTPTTSPSDLGTSGRNTRVMLVGKDGSPFQGATPVYYNRLNLELLHQREVVGVLDNFTNLSEALTAFNRDYGLGISIEELSPTTIKADGSIDFIISDSLVYYPGSKVTITPLSTLTSFEGWVDLLWYYSNYTLLSKTLI